MAQRGATFWLGVGLGLTLGTVTGALRPGAGASRMVVGLKQRATPEIIKELARDTKSRIVSVGPTGAYVLILPKAGQSAAQIQRASQAIRYVEPEVAMGVADEHEFLLVMPMKRLPGRIVGAPSDIRRK